MNFMGTLNQPSVPTEQEVREHIRLLRSASRRKLAVLSIAVLVTWGLWAALQEGEQKWIGVSAKYDAELVQLKTKYQIPADSDFSLDDSLGDVLSKLYAEPHSPFVTTLSPDKAREQAQFGQDLENLEKDYRGDLPAVVDQEALKKIEAEYNGRLSQLKQKYQIPTDLQFAISDSRQSVILKLFNDSRFAQGQGIFRVGAFQNDFVTLQGSFEDDLKAAADKRTVTRLDAQYGQRLSRLKRKYGIPADTQISLSDDYIDVLAELDIDRNPFEAESDKAVIHFETDFAALQGRYDGERGGPFLVHLRIPYLDNLVEIDGLELADWWPIGLMTILATVIVLHMRQRINAIIVSRFSTKAEELPERQSIIIRSDFRAGTLTESPPRGSRHLVYRSPLTLQPETLLSMALGVVVLYSSASFESFYNPVLSHKVDSTLVDYFAGVWFFFVILAGLIWLTHRRYASTLEKLVGCPVYGSLRSGLSRLARRMEMVLRRTTKDRAWLRADRLVVCSIMLVAVMALATLALPWMSPSDVPGYPYALYPNDVPGYRFLMPGSSPPIDDPGIFSELHVQLGVAVGFLLICFVTSGVALFVRSRLVDLMWRVDTFVGAVIATLAGNLIFHCVMLQLGASAFGLFGSATKLAAARAPRPADLGPLFSFDPAYGLGIFVSFCLLLTVLCWLRGWTSKARTQSILLNGSLAAASKPAA